MTINPAKTSRVLQTEAEHNVQILQDNEDDDYAQQAVCDFRERFGNQVRGHYPPLAYGYADQNRYYDALQHRLCDIRSRDRDIFRRYGQETTIGAEMIVSKASVMRRLRLLGVGPIFSANFGTRRCRLIGSSKRPTCAATGTSG